MRRHEVDRLGRDELRGDREVALVLAILVVDDDDEAARADLLDRLLDGREDGVRVRRCSPAHRTLAGVRPAAVTRGVAEQALDVLREHVDLEVDALPRERGAASVVSAIVCGISATPNASSCSSATVSETPSTVIDPFSTQ